MAFSAAVDWRGNSRTLLERYDQFSQVVFGMGPQPGHIAHYCVETDHGMQILDIFETEEQLRSFYARPGFRKALEDSGVPFQEPVIWRVHSYRHFQDRRRQSWAVEDDRRTFS